MAGAFKNFFAKLFGRGATLPEVNTRDYGPGLSASVGYGYSAYGYGSGGDGSKWQYGLSSTGATPILDHKILRRNARSAYHQTPAARSMVERFADSVPGNGLKLDPNPDHEALGITLEQAAIWAKTVESAFDTWARSKKIDRAEMMNFYQMQRFVSISQTRDGEWFSRLTYRKRIRGLNPLQLGFWDPDQISGYPLTDTAGIQWSIDGIEHDLNGREKAYNVLIRSKENEFKTVRIPARSRTGMPFVLHGFAAEYAGQNRGYPRISHAIQDFENITDFTSAQIKKAINEASIALWVEPSEDAQAVNPLSGMKSGPRSQFEAPIDPGTGTSAGNALIQFNELNDVNMRPGSVMVANLQAGEKLRTLDSKSVSESYSAFVDAFTGSLASSVSMPPEVLKLQFNQNYSASRAALMLFWNIVQIWRSEMQADFLEPVYEAWLSGEIAAGRIQAPGWSDPRMRSAWLRSNWIGFPMPNIDPMRTAKADEIYAWRLGAKDLDRISREQNGSSGAMNRAKLARQAKELTLPPWEANPNEATDVVEIEDEEE